MYQYKHKFGLLFLAMLMIIEQWRANADGQEASRTNTNWGDSLLKTKHCMLLPLEEHQETH